MSFSLSHSVVFFWKAHYFGKDITLTQDTEIQNRVSDLLVQKIETRR